MNNKTTEEVKLEKKLIPSTPASFDEYSDRAELLIESIRTDHVTNVGVISSYGGGKSSFIETFKQKLDKKKDGNLSVVSFINEKGDSTDLEALFIKQLIFSKEPGELKNSNFQRINTKVRKSVVFKIVASLFFLLSSLAILILLLSRKQDFVGNYGIGFSISQYYFATFTSLLILILSVCALVIIILRNFNSFTFKYKDFEISTNKGEKSSVESNLFTKYIDELIYFFQQTKTKILVLEDIDRCNSKSEPTDIFYKIKELNSTINNNSGIQKTGKVTFIYSVKNDFLPDAEKRSKFFDLIIDIEPVLTKFNAGWHICNNYRFNGFAKWIGNKECIDDISLYIENMRVLISIYNDCVVFVSKIGDKKNEIFSKISNAEIFTMKAYQNIFPEEYGKIEEGEGELIQFLNLVKTNKKTSTPFAYSKTELNFFDNRINKEHALFLKTIIQKGYITQYYRDIITANSTEGSWSSDDVSFLMNFRSETINEDMFDLSGLSIKRLYHHFKDSDYTVPYILNVDLLDYVLQCSNETRINSIFELLTKNENYAISFIKKYLSSRCAEGTKIIESTSVFLSKLINTRNDVLTIINGIDSLSNDRKGMLLLSCIFVGEVKADILFKDPTYDKIFDLINSTNAYDELVRNIDRCKYIFSHKPMNLKLINNIKAYSFSKETLGFIVNNKLFDINKQNIDEIGERYGYTEDFKTGHKFLSLKNSALFKYFDGNIEQFLNNFFLDLDTNKVSGDSLFSYSNNKIEIGDYIKLIEKRESSAPKINFISAYFTANESLVCFSKKIFNTKFDSSIFTLLNKKPDYSNIKNNVLKMIMSLQDLDNPTKEKIITEFLNEKNCNEDVASLVISNEISTNKNDLIYDKINNKDLKAQAFVLFYKNITDKNILKEKLEQIDKRYGQLFDNGKMVVNMGEVETIPGFALIADSLHLAYKKYKGTLRYWFDNQ